MSMGPVLSDRQRDVYRWYWAERRSLREIARWLDCSRRTAKRHVDELRLIYRSHGQNLPRFNLGHRRVIPSSEFVGVI
jgi:DNA-binding CsgD family transcriptional regulator